jgi:hypothetical protein
MLLKLKVSNSSISAILTALECRSEEFAMVIITVVTTLLALLLAYLVVRTQRDAPAQLAEPRARMATVGIQIICGNCSGEDETPIRTFLDRFGNCAQCGSSNYILASNVYAYRLRSLRPAGVEGVSVNGQVLPFASPSCMPRMQKLAI